MFTVPYMSRLRFPQVLCLCSCITAANGLRPSEEGERPPSVAVCVSGNFRTFGQEVVFKSVPRFYADYLQFRGQSGLEPDIFVWGTMDGAGPKGQSDYDFPAINANESEVRAALDYIRPVAAKIVKNAVDLTPSNVKSHVPNVDECFRHGFWEDPEKLARSLNHLAHTQACIDMILDWEARESKVYDVVVLTRPDYFYKNTVVDLGPVVEDGIQIYHYDFWMAMPRKLAGNLVKPGLGRPLSCSPGQRCCQRVQRSEDMWEFLTGAKSGDGGGCHCSDFNTVAHYQHLGDVVRPLA